MFKMRKLIVFILNVVDPKVAMYYSYHERKIKVRRIGIESETILILIKCILIL